MDAVGRRRDSESVTMVPVTGTARAPVSDLARVGPGVTVARARPAGPGRLARALARAGAGSQAVDAAGHDS